VSLVVCGVGASMLWEENYGESDTSDPGSNKREEDAAKWHDGLRNALITSLRNRDILMCGAISSLFEGSMYIFVFMWTPFLKAFLVQEVKGENQELPFGLIFSTFMVSCMSGSALFSILVDKYPVEKLGIFVFGVASLAMGLVALGVNETLSFIGMNVFEMTVGMYFPIMGTMKGGIVPEDKRAAIYTLFRIPLNFIVLFSLLTNLTPAFSFALNATMLGMATVLQTVLAKRRKESTGTPDHYFSKDVEAADKREMIRLKDTPDNSESAAE
jgi:MFS family permease